MTIGEQLTNLTTQQVEKVSRLTMFNLHGYFAIRGNESITKKEIEVYLEMNIHNLKYDN